MMPPDLSEGLCAQLAPSELEETFFFPGSLNVALAPSPKAQRAWNQAKEVCIECPVFLRCREGALGAEYGVVGGYDEHERHLIRRRLTRRLAADDAAGRARLAAYLHARHAGGLGDSPKLLARSTGYSSEAIRALIAEHQAVLDERASARPAPPEPQTRVQVRWFPSESPPRADGWVWYRGRPHAGHYVAETEDGVYVLMKIKPAAAQTTRWFPAEEVDLRAAVCPQVRTWVGRPTEGRADAAQDNQRPGQSAA